MPSSDFSRSDLMVNNKKEIAVEETTEDSSSSEETTSSKKITILGAQGWLPYVFATEEGQVPEGAGFEIFERALEGTGYTMEVQPVVGWSRLLELVKMSQIDVVAGIYYNDERAEVYEFSEPFAQDRTVLWVKAGKEFDFNSLSDLDGKIAVLPSGGSYGDDFEAQKEKMTVKSVEGKDQAFELLLSDLGDFYVSSYTDMKASIIKNGYEDKIVALPKSIAENDVYFVMALDNPNVAVMDQLNENIKAMKVSGEIEEILLEALMK
jgi:polar amino acid transport system substrate-binding protein